MKNNYMLVFFSLFFSSLSVAQGKKNFTPEKLKANFENILKINREVFYEQRLYRNPFIGLYEINHALPDSTIKVYIPLIQGMPVGSYIMGKEIKYVHLSSEQRKAYLKNGFSSILQKKYKLDLWLQPYFAAIFGNFDQPIQSNVGIGLQTQLFILPGLSLSTGILFPILNQMDGRSKTIHPTATYLNQFYSNGDHFFSATAGLFNNNQYGLNFQYRNSDLSKNWSYGIETGLTGYYEYPKGGIYVGKLEEFILLGDVAYRFKTNDVSLKITGGQFLWGDRGVRTELIRQFTNVEIGIYATKTFNGSTVGFNFALPIPPGKIAQGKNIRLRSTDEFRWEYTYTRGYKIGERYRVGYQLDQRLRQYNSQYLNGQYIRLIQE